MHPGYLINFVDILVSQEYFYDRKVSTFVKNKMYTGTFALNLNLNLNCFVSRRCYATVVM